MPLTILTLRDHPDTNDAWLCNSTRMQVTNEIQRTGVDPNAPIGPENRSRVLARFMLPYMENIAAVTDVLGQKADAAEAQFLDVDIDVDFDRHGLVTAITQVRQLQRDIDAYIDLTHDAENLSEQDQQTYLADYVYAPFFLGSGFATIGDDTSPWVKRVSVYCQPVLLGVALRRSIQGHEVKWTKMDRHTGVGTGTWVLGLAVLGAGALFFRRR